MVVLVFGPGSPETSFLRGLSSCSFSITLGETSSKFDYSDFGKFSAFLSVMKSVVLPYGYINGMELS